MSTMPPYFSRALHAARRAFTLAELLVVILIMVILVLIAVPAFSAMLYSSESSMAETLLRSALRSGRDAAIRSTGHDDAAIVFFFEPGGRCTMVPCVKAGEVQDIYPPNTAVTRDLFVPSEVLEPVQLPRNWTVRGYAPLNSIDDAWYEPPGQRYGVEPSRGDWVFPETGLYFKPTTPAANSGYDRQTFMVRFEAGSGLMTTASSRPALIFAPSMIEPAGLNGLDPAFRTLRRQGPRRYVERVLTDTFSNPFLPAAQRAAKIQSLLGDQSIDTVLTRAVGQVALCDETKLASALGVRLDPTTASLYLPWNGNLAFVPGVGSNVMVNRWIEGDTNLNGRIEPRTLAGDAPEAKVFTIDRYTAVLRVVEVQR